MGSISEIVKSTLCGFSLSENKWVLPCFGGIIIALIASVILRFDYIWALLSTSGLAVALLSLTARNFKHFWLAVFALTLPLEIKKMLIDSTPMFDLIKRYGFLTGELPGPVLYLSDLPFMILLLQWTYDIIIKKQEIIFPKSNVMALAFIGWSGLSLIGATFFSFGFFDLIRTVKYYFLYLYVANNVRSKETVMVLMKFFLIGLIFQGLLCLYQFLIQNTGLMIGALTTKQDLYNDVYSNIQSIHSVSEGGGLRTRASGTVGLNNSEAQYFELLLPLSFMFWLTATNVHRRLFIYSSSLLGLLGMIVTFSRGGLLGITAGTATVLFLAGRFQLISGRKFLTLLLTGLAFCILVSPLAYSYIATRPESSQARLHLAKVGLEMVKANPILGVGLNNHVIQKPEYDPMTFAFGLPTHNTFIIIASEIGIPGLVFFIGFLVLTFMSALKGARSPDPYLAAVAVGIIGGLVSLMLHVQFDFINANTNYSLLWLFAGMAAVIGGSDLNTLIKTGHGDKVFLSDRQFAKNNR